MKIFQGFTRSGEQAQTCEFSIVTLIFIKLWSYVPLSDNDV